MDDLKHSPLESVHLELGARMVPFAKWSMPIQYDGILAEHQAVRDSVGMFDISHMGQLSVTGHGAAAWLDTTLTNHVGKLEVGEGQYTLLLNQSGGVIDDLIIYRTGDEEFFLVVNASKIDEDYETLYDRLDIESGIELENRSPAFGGMAVQGPKALEVFDRMMEGLVEIPARFGIAQIETTEGEIVVCRTGYTGEDGFELFATPQTIADWWQKAASAGAKPCGLGARDSLRLEKCYPLNGNDLSPDRTPLQAGLGFAVDLEKGDFIGRNRLVTQKAEGLGEKLVALKMTEKGPPPRHGYAVCQGEQVLGELTSGGLSPALGCGIGMVYVPVTEAKIGSELEIEIRGRRFPAVIVKKPFV